MEELAQHPTVKPTQLVADALKDVTRRGALVLDTFVGSGTTILAGEKVGRCVRAVEIEPRYAQVAARRWEKMTGRDAVHAATGQTLDELAGRPLSHEATTVVPEQRVRVRSRPVSTNAVDDR
jgi:predicted O-methyltransferase YrrM